jgi:DDE superfamily endonuclease
MLPLATVPPCLFEMLQACRGVFGAPGFATFMILVVGALGAVGPRTITGIWAATGLADRLHWSRAHRFFSETKWDPDTLGLHLAHLAVSLFVAAGTSITIAVDDTLFHRYGKLVHGAAWQHDGSAKGRDGVGRGNCFVVVGLVVTVPFMARAVLLPILFRLYTPKDGPSKTEHARSMVNLLSRSFAERPVHVVADALYRGPAWRNLPGNVTFTTRLSRTAVLYGPQPEPTGKRGHPAWKGPRLGTPSEIAATAAWRKTTVTRYGDTGAVLLADISCLWWGSLHRTALRLILVRDLDRHRCDLALITTDLVTSAEDLVARYCTRWSIEQTIKDGKDLLGVGDAQNRLKLAVERTVPFMLLTLTILVCWYARFGDAEADLTKRRNLARWYRRKKTTISVTDMLIAFRRTRITAVHTAQTTPDLNDHTAVTSTVKAA